MHISLLNRSLLYIVLKLVKTCLYVNGGCYNISSAVFIYTKRRNYCMRKVSCCFDICKSELNSNPKSLT